MKKVLMSVIVAIVASISSMAHASEYMGIDLGNSKNKAINSQTTHYGTVTYGQSLGHIDVEGRLGVGRTTDTFVDSNFADVRGRVNFDPIVGLNPWLRGTIGETFSNGTNAGYWAFEPGVTYKVTPSLNAELSVQRTELFNRNWSAADQSTYTLGAVYSVNAKNSVSLRYLKSVDGTQPTAYEFGYVRSFQ
jgi:hypothetical protein